jgi:hypothetical protein
MRLAVTTLGLASALIALPLVSAQPLIDLTEKSIELPFGEKNWDLSPMKADPVNLVKVSASQVSVRAEDPVTKERFSTEVKSVRFLLEFTRDLTVRDTDWTGVRPEPPFRFEFLDADGVTLRIVPGTYEGTPIGLKGRRVRVVLRMPEESVMGRTRKVVVAAKPYAF